MAPDVPTRAHRRRQLKAQLLTDLVNGLSLYEGEAWSDQLDELELDYDDFGRVVGELADELYRRSLRLP